MRDAAGLVREAPRRLLSIDVGVRNMGVCELCWGGETEGCSIGAWGTVALGSGPGSGCLVDAAVTAARELLGEGAWDAVVIENQPCLKNPRMKTVQVALHAYARSVGAPVVLAPASCKCSLASRMIGEPPVAAGARGAYGRRKRAVVAAARRWVSERLPRELPRLESSRKKDDMCDALVQGLWHLERSGEICVALSNEGPGDRERAPGRDEAAAGDAGAHAGVGGGRDGSVRDPRRVPPGA
jgi:hypothetical protein